MAFEAIACYRLGYRGTAVLAEPVRPNANVPDRVRYAQRVSQTPFRVVIAEDEALIRLDLKEMLEEDGYVVVGEASDGEAAVKLTESLRPDLVIMDIKMPGLDGISAAERITAEHLAAVVILTAFSQRDLVLRARDAGAMAFLVKPFTKADLVPAIEIAVSRFQEVSALETEVTNLKERLEVRKLLDRAKGLLQAERGMTEAEAFRWIQKSSMDRRMTMRAVAEEVLQGAQSAAPDPADSQNRDPREAEPGARESGPSQASGRKSGGSEPSGTKTGPGKTGRSKAAEGEAGGKSASASETGESPG
jgi:two-component system, response regulator PdtaR